MDTIYDNPIYQGMLTVCNVIILNLMWLACCIPVITVGAATTALYKVTFRIARGKDYYVFKDFVRSFRENFRQATLLWLADLAVIAVLAADVYISVWKIGGTLPSVIAYGLVILFASVYAWQFGYLSQFTDGNRKLVSNCIRLAAAYLPRTLLMVWLMACPFLLLYVFSGAPAVAGGILFFCGFSLTAIAKAMVMTAAFRKAGLLPPEEAPMGDSWTVGDPEEEQAQETEKAEDSGQAQRQE